MRAKYAPSTPDTKSEWAEEKFMGDSAILALTLRSTVL